MHCTSPSILVSINTNHTSLYPSPTVLVSRITYFSLSSNYKKIMTPPTLTLVMKSLSEEELSIFKSLLL